MTGELLLVEDRAEDLELALHALEAVGGTSHVHVARHGQEALDLLGDPRVRARVAVVLLDLKLPGLDGFEVLRRLREHPATRRVPVVALSTSTDAADVDRAYALGANAYVAKPMCFERFKEALAGVAAFWLAANRRA